MYGRVVRRRRAPARRVAVRRRATGVYGRGSYNVGSALRTIAAGARKVRSWLPEKGLVPGTGMAIGRALGGYLGPAGSVIGASLGDRLGKWSGVGDYKLQGNTLAPSPPSFASTKGAGVRIRHREYIQDVQSSILFNNQFAMPINPALYESFPWLSGIASNFTQYRFHGLIYEYKPTSGSAIASTNNALGVVIMATNYNAGDSVFTNKQQMENEEFSSSTVPSEAMVHAVECKTSQTSVERLYTRSAAVPSGQDIRLYDLGLFQLAVQGMQVGTGQGGVSSVDVGELWATYDVEFYKPQLDEYEGITNLGTHIRNVTSVAAATPLGTAANALVKYDSIGVTLSTTTITMPAGYIGNYMCNCQWIGTATSSLAPPAITLTNATALNLINADSSNIMLGPTGGTDNSTNIVQCFSFAVTNPTVQTVLTFGTGGTLPVSVTQLDVILTQLPFGMTS